MYKQQIQNIRDPGIIFGYRSSSDEGVELIDSPNSSLLDIDLIGPGVKSQYPMYPSNGWLKLTLPASEAVWNCPSAEDIPGLLWDEPAGRSRTNFRDLVRNALLTIGSSHRKLRSRRGPGRGDACGHS